MNQLKSLLGSYIVTTVLLFVLALLLYRLQLGSQAVEIGIIVIYAVSTIVGGFLVGRREKKKKFIWGLLVGFCYFALLAAVSLAVNKSFDGGSTFFTTLAICSGGGMLGGMLS